MIDIVSCPDCVGHRRKEECAVVCWKHQHWASRYSNHQTFSFPQMTCMTRLYFLAVCPGTIGDLVSQSVSESVTF